MGQTAQTGFDTTSHNWHISKGFATLLRVNSDCPIRTLATQISSCIGVVMAQTPICSVAIDHRIHIAGSDTKVEIGLAQHSKALGIAPVRLGNNTHPVTLGLKHTADYRHTKARMIHIGVPCHQDHIAAIPAQLIHLFPRHRQERRWQQTFCPVFRVVIKCCRWSGSCCHGVYMLLCEGFKGRIVPEFAVSRTTDLRRGKSQPRAAIKSA